MEEESADNEVGAEYIIMEKAQPASIRMVRYIIIAIFPTVNWCAGKVPLSSASVSPFADHIGRVRRLEWTSIADRVQYIHLMC